MASQQAVASDEARQANACGCSAAGLSRIPDRLSPRHSTTGMAFLMTTRPGAVPTLHPGDRLSRREFERRFDATPDLKRAELIEGIVYVASPVRHLYHGHAHSVLHAWLAFYVKETPGLDLGTESSLRTDEDNMPQPDALLRVPERHGGRSRIDDEGYLVGPPELIGEVAASSVSYDLHQKLEVYRRSGVLEYVVHRVDDAAVDWFVLREGRYVRQEADAAGIQRSTVFPGLWLDVRALLRGDLAALCSCIERGIADPAHAAFAARLRSRE